MKGKHQKKRVKSLIKQLLEVEQRRFLEGREITQERWSQFVFSHILPPGFATMPGCQPVELAGILPSFDQRALRVIRKQMSYKGAVSLAEFLRIVVLKAGAYDRARITDFIAGLVAVYNDILPGKFGTQIQWRDFSELVVSSSETVGVADPSTVLSNGLAAVCRAQAQDDAEGAQQPQLTQVAQIPGGLLMPHETKHPLTEFEKRRARDLRTADSEPSPLQEHAMRRVLFIPELDVLVRIENESKQLSLYHPRTNVIKIVRPEFEKKDRPSLGDDDGILPEFKKQSSVAQPATDRVSEQKQKEQTKQEYARLLEEPLHTSTMMYQSEGSRYFGGSQSTANLGAAAVAAAPPDRVSQRDAHLVMRTHGKNPDDVDRAFADGSFCRSLVHQMTDQNKFHVVDCAYHPERILLTILCTNKRATQFSLLYSSGNVEQDIHERGIETRIAQEAEFLLGKDYDELYFCRNVSYAEDVFLCLSTQMLGVMSFYQFAGETHKGYPLRKLQPVFVNDTIHKGHKITGFVEVPNTHSFLTCSRDSSICLWDGRTLAVDLCLDTGYSVACLSMALSAEPHCLATCYTGFRTVPVWNLEKGIFRGLRTNLWHHEHPVVQVRYFERALFSLDDKSFVVLWDSKELLPLQVIGGFPLRITSMVCTAWSRLRLWLVGDRVTYFASNTAADEKLFAHAARAASQSPKRRKKSTTEAGEGEDEGAIPLDPSVGLHLSGRSGVVYSLTKKQVFRHSRQNPLHTDVVFSTEEEQTELSCSAVAPDGMLVLGTNTGRVMFLRGNNGYMLRKYAGAGERRKKAGTFSIEPPDQAPEQPPRTKGDRRRELEELLCWGSQEGQKVYDNFEEPKNEKNARDCRRELKASRSARSRSLSISSIDENAAHLDWGEQIVAAMKSPRRSSVLRTQKVNLEKPFPTSPLSEQSGWTISSRSAEELAAEERRLDRSGASGNTSLSSQQRANLSGSMEVESIGARTRSNSPIKTARTVGTNAGSAGGTPVLGSPREDSAEGGGVGNQKRAASDANQTPTSSKRGGPHASGSAAASHIAGGLCTGVTCMEILVRKKLEQEDAAHMTLQQAVAATSTGLLSAIPTEEATHGPDQACGFFDAREGGTSTSTVGKPKVGDKLLVGSKEGSLFLFDLVSLDLDFVLPYASKISASSASASSVENAKDPERGRGAAGGNKSNATSRRGSRDVAEGSVEFGAFDATQKGLLPGGGLSTIGIGAIATTKGILKTAASRANSQDPGSDIKSKARDADTASVASSSAAQPQQKDLRNLLNKPPSLPSTTDQGDRSALQSRASSSRSPSVASGGVQALLGGATGGSNAGGLGSSANARAGPYAGRNEDRAVVSLHLCDDLVCTYHKDGCVQVFEAPSMLKVGEFFSDDGGVFLKVFEATQFVLCDAERRYEEDKVWKRKQRKKQKIAMAKQEQERSYEVSLRKAAVKEINAEDFADGAGPNVAKKRSEPVMNSLSQFFFVMTVARRKVYRQAPVLPSPGSMGSTAGPANGKKSIKFEQEYSQNSTSRLLLGRFAQQPQPSETEEEDVPAAVPPRKTQRESLRELGFDSDEADDDNGDNGENGEHGKAAGQLIEETVTNSRVFLVKRNTQSRKVESVTLKAQLDDEWLCDAAGALTLAHLNAPTVPLPDHCLSVELREDAILNNGGTLNGNGDGQPAGDGGRGMNDTSAAGFGETANAFAQLEAGPGASSTESEEQFADEDPALLSLLQQDPTFESLVDLSDYAGAKTLCYVYDKKGMIHCVDMLDLVRRKDDAETEVRRTDPAAFIDAVPDQRMEHAMSAAANGNGSADSEPQVETGDANGGGGAQMNKEEIKRYAPYELSKKYPATALFNWKAHQGEIVSLDAVANPPSLISIDVLHTCKVWSAAGECYAQFQQGGNKSFAVSIWPPPQVLVKTLYFMRQARRFKEQFKFDDGLYSGARPPALEGGRSGSRSALGSGQAQTRKGGHSDTTAPDQYLNDLVAPSGSAGERRAQ
eukprot:g13705.t1